MQCCTRQDIGGFATMLAGIGQEHRLQIVCILQKEGELCVCEIIEKLGISQNLVSHHLKVLKDLGLLKTKRAGKNIHYMIDTKNFDVFKKNIQHIFSF